MQKLSVVLLLSLSTASVVQAQLRTEVLDSLIREHVYTFTLHEEHMEGRGADLMRGVASGARSVLLGESHHSRAIPQFTVALFKVLQADNGLQHLVVEEGPALGTALNRALRTPASGGALGVARKFPNAFHLYNESEVRLFDRIGELSSADDPIWAVNQEFGLAHVYARLVEIAPHDAARELASELLKRSLEYEGERHARDTSYISAIANEHDFARLRTAFAAAGGEAESLIAQASLSHSIYAPYRRGNAAHFSEYHASNAAREDNMKLLFSRLAGAHAADGYHPRVLVKSGHTHMGRGRGYPGMLTFGNFLSELARGNGEHSLHLYVVLNWEDMDQSWLAPFVPHISAGTNTVFDLRHVEAWAVSGRIGSMDGRLSQLLTGYDMLVVLGDTTQASIAALCTPNFNWYTGIPGCR